MTTQSCRIYTAVLCCSSTIRACSRRRGEPQSAIVMPIQSEDNFLVSRDLGITPSIGIQSEKIRDCIAAIKTKGFEGVFGSPTFGFHENNLNFLVELPHLRQVWFWDCKFESIEGLYAIEKLAYCGVMPTRPGIDFARFPHLKTLVTHWNMNDTGIVTAPVEHFYFWHYKPKSKSFGGLEFPSQVQLLELNWVNPVSLEGLRPLIFLKELSIHRSRNIEDLSLLPYFAPNLKKLIVTTSGKLKNLSGIEDHPSLELAAINGKRVKG